MHASEKPIKKSEAQESWSVIKNSHQLNGDTQALADYYKCWAKTYDRDVEKQGYRGPGVIADLLDELVPRDDAKSGRDGLAVADAGCGTGLSGVALAKCGFGAIDGFDLSHEMIVEARKTSVYRSLSGGVNMNEPPIDLNDDRYDVAVCCGVFTLGHVNPSGLGELARITRKGGLVLVSTRKSYYDSTDFDLQMRELEVQGYLRLLRYLKNAPYLAEEGAHYWAFESLLSREASQCKTFHRFH